MAAPTRYRTVHLRLQLLGALGLSACWGELPELIAPPPPGRANPPPAPPPACEPRPAPVAVFPEGWELAEPEPPVDDGLVLCASGVVHRPEAVECPNLLVEPDRERPGGSLCNGDSGCLEYSTCGSDADCTEAAYGHCSVPPGSQILAFSCQYGCLSDDDCGAGRLCLCGDPVGRCTEATCRGSADCEEGYLCAGWNDPKDGIGCGATMKFACQTPEDECSQGACGFGYCIVQDGRRVCDDELTGGACGRPFLVEGHARQAALQAGTDFHGDWVLCPEVESLTAGERRVLASFWGNVAQMEHASVAAFARFALQLLHLGAPRELLLGAQAAMADETSHAELACKLASAYAGASLTPGPLPLEGALSDTELEAIVALTIEEGCVGETLAAMEADEALQACTDPAVREVLERISADEARHAELAWRFVAWALGEHPQLRQTVEAAFAGSVARVTEASAVKEPPELDVSQYGVISAEQRRSVHRAALRDVVTPCARALLESTRGTASPQVRAAASAV